MSRVMIPGKTVAMLEALAEALPAPQQKCRQLPVWLPDGSEAKTLGQLAPLTGTDVLGAALYVLEAKEAGATVSPELVAEAQAELKAQPKLVPGFPLLPPPSSDSETGIAVMLPIPLDVSREIAIPGAMPAEQLHVTIAYYGSTEVFNRWPDEPEQAPLFAALVRQAAIQLKPFGAELNGLTRFSTPRDSVGDPIVVNVDSPYIAEVREQVLRFCGDPASEHGFTPHMTIGYLPMNEPMPESIQRWQPRPVRFNTIVLGWGGKYIPFALGDGGHLDEMKDIFHGAGSIPITRTASVPQHLLRRSRISDRITMIKRPHKRRKPPRPPKLKMDERLMEMKELAEDIEEKAVRRVRTPAGERRFGQPIGSIIVRDGARPLAGLRITGSPYPGWDLVKGSDGKEYYVGKDDDTGNWVATEDDDWDKVRVEVGSEEEVYEKLSAYVTRKSKTNTRKPAAKKEKQTPLKASVKKGKSEYEGFDKYTANGTDYYVQDHGPEVARRYSVFDKDDALLYEGNDANQFLNIQAMAAPTPISKPQDKPDFSGAAMEPQRGKPKTIVPKKKPTWDNMLGEIPPEGFTDADRVQKQPTRLKSVHKASKLAINEAVHVVETQRDDGNDPGFEVQGNQVIVYDKDKAVNELIYQQEIHRDNADPATNPDAQDRARAKRRADAMQKLIDDIRQNGQVEPNREARENEARARNKAKLSRGKDADSYTIVKKPKNTSDTGIVEYRGQRYEINANGGVLAGVTVTDEDGIEFHERGGSTTMLSNQRSADRERALKEALKRAYAARKPDVSDDARNPELLRPKDIQKGDTILDWYGGPGDIEVESVKKIPKQSFGGDVQYVYLITYNGNQQTRIDPWEWRKVRRGNRATIPPDINDMAEKMRRGGMMNGGKIGHNLEFAAQRIQQGYTNPDIEARNEFLVTAMNHLREIQDDIKNPTDRNVVKKWIATLNDIVYGSEG